MTRYAIDPATLVHLARTGARPRAEDQLVAPNSLRTAAVELLLDEVRAGDLTEREAIALMTPLTEIKVRLLGDRVSRRTAWDLARKHDWSTLRDAEYLAVAMLQADALVTADPELAARAEGVVPVATVSDLVRA